MDAAARRVTRYLLVAALVSLPAFTKHVDAAAPRPNIVFILADDLGYGDLSFYAANDIETPSLDRLAREGVRFTDYYSAGNTCSPSRAALMTGRYPARSGVNAVLFHDTAEGLPQSELTIAELLRDAGYRTAMVGKWHLGNTDEFMPWNHGFAEFFGVAHSNDQANFFVYDGRRRLPETVDQAQLIRRYTDRALEFLTRTAQRKDPFFLYLAYNAPHVPLYPSAGFAGRSRRGTYGDVVQELDASIGEVLGRLTALGLERDTLVIFTSDNGPWLAMRDLGGSAGSLCGGKTSTFEGGHRVPAIARWPGRIPPDTQAHDVANMMDWLPTLVDLAGAQLPHDRAIDGRSLVDVLQGGSARAEIPFFYFRLRLPLTDQHPEVGAVRVGRWKLKLAQRGYPHLLEPLAKAELYRHGLLLFDLETDPGEQHDVAAEHPEIVARLSKEIETFQTTLSPAVPVRISAAPYDHTGWEKFWCGLGAAAAVVVGLVGLVLFIALRIVRSLRRRRRPRAGVN